MSTRVRCGGAKGGERDTVRERIEIVINAS